MMALNMKKEVRATRDNLQLTLMRTVQLLRAERG